MKSDTTTPTEALFYAYSFDEETYTGKYTSREEALCEGFSDNPDAESVWTGECVTPHRTPYADSLIEQVAMHTTEESGEWSEDYLSNLPKVAKEELQTELQELWDRWEAKHGLEPTWYNVEEVQKHDRSEVTTVDSDS